MTSMHAARRREWIVEHLTKMTSNGFGSAVDVLDDQFVTAYIAVTGATHQVMAFGAPRCPPLGRDLTAMHRLGLLARFRVGIRGAERGFPRWVWVYELTGAAASAQQANA